MASLPLYRFYAALDGGVLELKEARDAPALPLQPGVSPLPLAHNAERVVFAQRVLQPTPTADPWLGFAALPDDPRIAFVAKTRAPLQKGLSRTRIATRLADGRWNAADVVALGASLGHLLAEAHARAPRSPERSKPARDALARLADDADLVALITDELVDYARWMAARILEDHALFVALLDAYGPLLEDAP